MFYPVESLRRGGRFYLCWVADSWPLQFAAITQRQLWSQDIRQICDDLLKVIQQESGRPSNRFSLRLSSQLIRGVVRLYQRKVTVLAGDLFMINAYVMKSTHKRSPQKHDTHERSNHPLPRLVFEEQPDEERVLELIQNSGNVVARVTDITLNEPTLPEIRPIDDGFGEMQSLQQTFTMSDQMEMMMARDRSAAQHSAMDLQLDFSTDKSHDKSRLLPHEAAQMERISEHDISGLRKSTGAEFTITGDLEKEIPEISEIPPPELTASQEMQTGVDKNVQAGRDITESVPVLDQRPANVISLEEISVRELEQQQLARKRKHTKLRIDKKTKLSSNYMRSRVANNDLEMREEVIDDITHVPAYMLFEQPAHVGYTVRHNLGRALRRMYLRNHGYVKKQTGPALEIEEPLARTQSGRVSVPNTINVDAEPLHTVPQIVVEPPEIAPDPNISATDPFISALGPDVVLHQMDISDMPTQRIRPSSQVDAQAGMVSPPKRQRHSGYMSFKDNQRMAMETDLEMNKENMPTAERMESLLHEAGLADNQEKPTVTQPNIQIETVRKYSSDSSETLLGSLDRTKVSLGDSERTTDTARFIRDEWGTQGTMIKVYKCIQEGVKPLSMPRLMQKGPVLNKHRRAVAAKCFYSLLKLKQHQFIRISKDPYTLEIMDIDLGPRLQEVLT